MFFFEYNVGSEDGESDGKQLFSALPSSQVIKIVTNDSAIESSNLLEKCRLSSSDGLDYIQINYKSYVQQLLSIL